MKTERHWKHTVQKVGEDTLQSCPAQPFLMAFRVESHLQSILMRQRKHREHNTITVRQYNFNEDNSKCQLHQMLFIDDSLTMLISMRVEKIHIYYVCYYYAVIHTQCNTLHSIYTQAWPTVSLVLLLPFSEGGLSL